MAIIGYYNEKATREVTRRWETASNYTVYETVPGSYPVTDSGYWNTVSIGAVQIKEYFVNRIFQHSSAHESTERIPGKSFGVSWDDYNLAKAVIRGAVDLAPGYGLKFLGVYNKSVYDDAGRHVKGPDGNFLRVPDVDSPMVRVAKLGQ